MTLEKDESIIKEEDDENRDDSLLLFIDEDNTAKDACIAARILIYTKEKPTWSYRKIVAAAHAYCKKKRGLGDAEISSNVSMSETLERIKSISLTRFATLIKIIKSQKGLKVGHMGILPIKAELPMKNLNRLQTKMERQSTEEEMFLTTEELQRRSQYATMMKKQDSYYEIFEEFLNSYIEENPDIIKDSIYKAVLDEIKIDNYMVIGDAKIESINAGLNNVIKFPIILAREMVQEYKEILSDGTEKVEYHFKPYSELKAAIVGIEELPIMIEHQDGTTSINTVAIVKNLRADDNIRGIRGIGYAAEKKLPKVVLDAIKAGLIVPVSIGFFAHLGDGGEFNGQKYNFTQEDIVLNHLAICLESIPRCPEDLCGINHISEDWSEMNKNTVIKDTNDYLINLCNLNKIEDSNSQKTNINEGDNMQEDGFADPKSGKISAGNEPKDFEKWLTMFRAYINGVTEKELQTKYKKQIIKAFTDGDKNMDEKKEKELQDSIADKDEQIKKLQDTVKVYEDEKRTTLKEELKKWSSKFEDAELDGMNLKELALAVKIASKFEPSQEKAAVIPVEGKAKKEDAGQSPREDPSKIFAETNKKFDLSGL